MKAFFDYIQSAGGLSNFIILLIVCFIIVGVMVFVLSFLTKKWGLSFEIWKIFTVSRSKKDEPIPLKKDETSTTFKKEEVTIPTVKGTDKHIPHTACPLVGDVFLIIGATKDSSYKIYRNKYYVRMKEQMKVAQQHLDFFFDKVRQTYNTKLKEAEIERSHHTPLLRDLIAIYLLIARYSDCLLLEHFRECFKDNGIEEMTEAEWSSYKKEQTQLMIGKLRGTYSSFYPATIVGMTAGSIQFTITSDLERDLTDEINFIFDKARQISIEYAEKEVEITDSFQKNLCDILNCEKREARIVASEGV